MPSALYSNAPCWNCGQGVRRKHARISYDRIGDGSRATQPLCDWCLNATMKLLRELRPFAQLDEQLSAAPV